MFNKIAYFAFFCLCVLTISAVRSNTLVAEDMQVSVEGQHFDPNNFFAFEGGRFKKDAVDFNKGWLGIFMEDADGTGVLVKEITRESPAAEAGLKAGDIITKINKEFPTGRNVLNLIQFKKTIETIGAGGIPELTVLRGDTEMVFKPVLIRKLLKNIAEPGTPFVSSGCLKHAGISFVDFAMKNEKYKEMLDATLQRIGEEAYAREGFQSNEESNPFRLSLINYLMLHPFDTPGIGQAIIDPFYKKDVSAQLGFVAAWLDIKLDLPDIKRETGPLPPSFIGDDVKDSSLIDPLSPSLQGGGSGVIDKSPNVPSDTVQSTNKIGATDLQGKIQVVVDSLPYLVLLVKEAFRDLSEEEVDFLYQNAHTVWLPNTRIEAQDLAMILTLSQKVDLAKLFSATTLLLRKLAPFFDEQGIDNQENTHSEAPQTKVSAFRLPASLHGANQPKISDEVFLGYKPSENVAGAGEKARGDLSTNRTLSTGGRELGGGGTRASQDFAGDILFVQDTSIGKIVVGGTGTTYYYADAAVIIDLGGDDYYFNNAGSSNKEISVSLCIDFSGDDTYQTDDPFTQGTGRFGIGILMDCRGNDQYLSKDFSQGACLFGVGLLLDNDGDDFYDGRVVNQGVGFFGAGLLSDTKGNDAYFSRQFAQGVGFTKGFGALTDADGNDYYFAGGVYPDFRDPEKSYQSMSQGIGMGIRPEETIVGASGGLGILFDQKGCDTYHGDYFAQGSGYYFSFGLLYDRDGNDRYYAGRYAQGAGIHSAIGLLKDTSGDDTYECTLGVSQGCGHDTGIGFLVDNYGDDTYRSKTTSQGVGLEKGIGVLADFYGNDVYQANDNSQGVSFPSKTEEIRGMGMLIDNQGNQDIFHETIAENLLFYGPNGGLVLNK